MLYMYINERKVVVGGDFKEFVQVFAETSKSKICRVGPEAGNPRKNCSLHLKAVCWQLSLFLMVEVSFFLQMG